LRFPLYTGLIFVKFVFHNQQALDIGNHIKELLRLHDCVILPGLGGFVANYRPAEFNAARNTASPPSKHILFNTNLIHNDGLLYAHISEVTGYGYKDVQDLVLEYIEHIRRDTGKGSKFIIEGLGYFYSDSEKNIQFDEEAGNNFLLDSYGLPFIQYSEVEGFLKPDSYRSLRLEPEPLARQRRIRRWAYGSVAACLLAAAVLVPLRTGYFNRAGIEIPVADSFQKSSLAETNITAEPSTQGFSNVSIKSIPLPAPEYHIIVGSFKDFGNARQFRNHLAEKGINARILGYDKNIFRVSAGTYTDQAEAENNLVSVRSNYNNAWILIN